LRRAFIALQTGTSPDEVGAGDRLSGRLGILARHGDGLEDPAVAKIIEDAAVALDVERREISAEEIVERCIYGLVNEGAKILEEGIAQRPSDIDIVYLYGYAFPVAKGGPMFYADQVGLGKVYKRICEFNERTQNGSWEPAPLLKQFAQSGKSFADWAKENA